MSSGTIVAVLGVGDCLSLGDVSNEALAVLRKLVLDFCRSWKYFTVLSRVVSCRFRDDRFGRAEVQRPEDGIHNVAKKIA